MRNPRKALSRKEILRRVWNYDFGGRSSIVDLYVSYLRKKIDTGPRADDPHRARRRLHAAAGRNERFAQWQSWTCFGQLVVGVSAVVMVALLAVGTLSVLTLRSSVSGHHRHPADRARPTASATVGDQIPDHPACPTGELPPPGAMKPLTQLIGQAPGNVIALIQNGKVVDSAHFVDGEAGRRRRRPSTRSPSCRWTGTRQAARRTGRPG